MEELTEDIAAPAASSSSSAPVSGPAVRTGAVVRAGPGAARRGAAERGTGDLVP